MDEYNRAMALEALIDYRRWFDEKEINDIIQIQGINEAEENIQALFIPENREENIQYAIEALEELLDFDWNAENQRFINSTILKLKSFVECDCCE